MNIKVIVVCVVLFVIFSLWAAIRCGSLKEKDEYEKKFKEDTKK